MRFKSLNRQNSGEGVLVTLKKLPARDILNWNALLQGGGTRNFKISGAGPFKVSWEGFFGFPALHSQRIWTYKTQSVIRNNSKSVTSPFISCLKKLYANDIMRKKLSIQKRVPWKSWIWLAWSVLYRDQRVYFLMIHFLIVLTSIGDGDNITTLKASTAFRF